MNGIILVDKPCGMTSREVVDRISRILQTKKIGHTGTLDPIATGVLVLCVGRFTKMVDLITGYDKEYIAEVILGIETDTLDIDGKIIKEISDVRVTKEQIQDVLKSFVGKIIQEVPKYSAIKINGRRLYSYTRSNIDIELPKREVHIHELDLISDLEVHGDKIKFKIKCHVSKGTYIRSLIRDIGVKLQIPACMLSLRRTAQGNFKIESCYTLECVENNQYKMLGINDILSYLEEITISKDNEFSIKNGNIIDKEFIGEMAKFISETGEMLAIYQTYDKDNTKAKPYIMF